MHAVATGSRALSRVGLGIITAQAPAEILNHPDDAALAVHAQSGSVAFDARAGTLSQRVAVAHRHRITRRAGELVRAPGHEVHHALQVVERTHRLLPKARDPRRRILRSSRSALRSSNSCRRATASALLRSGIFDDRRAGGRTAVVRDHGRACNPACLLTPSTL